MNEKQMKLFKHKKEMFESPIEEKVYNALCRLKRKIPITIKSQFSIFDSSDNRLIDWCRALQYYDGIGDESICDGCFAWSDEDGLCKFLHRFEDKRLDFAVFLGNNKIDIECDGKEFHIEYEKDEKRDKELIKNGWKVIRLGGTEIYNFKEKTLSRFIGKRIHEEIHNQAPARNEGRV